jgi:hypothetical protein
MGAPVGFGIGEPINRAMFLVGLWQIVVNCSKPPTLPANLRLSDLRTIAVQLVYRRVNLGRH